MTTLEQSLTLCILFAWLSGLCYTLSTASLSWPTIQKEQFGKEFSLIKWRLFYFSNIIFNVLGFAFDTFSTWFGPVSISVASCVSGYLIFSIVIFGFALKTEKIDKDTRVAMYIIAVAGIQLIFVGAEVKDEFDVLASFERPVALIWSAGVCLLSISSVCYQMILGCAKTKSTIINERRTFIALLFSQVTNELIADTASKMLSTESGAAFYVSLFLFLTGNALVLHASLLQAIAIDKQSTFFTTYTMAVFVANAVSGAIIWQDEIQNFGGYIIVFIYQVLGSYLLLDADILDLVFTVRTELDPVAEGIVNRSSVYDDRKSRINISTFFHPDHLLEDIIEEKENGEAAMSDFTFKI